MSNLELSHMNDERIASLETKVNLWMESTTEYRKALCSKLDRVLERLDNLPCDRGEEHARQTDCQLKSLWGIVSFVTISLITLAVAWGSLNKQVDINTGRWDRLLAHQEAQNGNIQ